MRPSYVQHLLETGLLVVAVAAVYYAVAFVGLLQVLGSESARLVFPQFGVALVALLVLGLRIWPGITLGSFLTLMTLGRPPTAALALATGATISLVGAYLLLRQIGFRIELDRLRDALALIAATLTGAVVLASINTMVLVSFRIESVSGFWSRWLLLWMSSALGVLVVAPALIVLRNAHWPRQVRISRAIEVGVLLVTTVVVMIAATRAPTELLFLAFPLLMWAALRFQLPAAAPCALIVAGAAVHAASHGLGPFEGQELSASLTTVQAFNGAIALTALLLSVAITERNNAHREIEQAANQLASLVSQLDRRMRPSPADRPRPKGDTPLRL